MGLCRTTVDSLGPRGIANACGGSVGASQAFDAYAAFRYLAAQDFVDPKRIAVLGQSMGGIAALYGVDYDIARNISPSASARRSPITLTASPRRD